MTTWYSGEWLICTTWSFLGPWTIINKPHWIWEQFIHSTMFSCVWNVLYYRNKRNGNSETKTLLFFLLAVWQKSFCVTEIGVYMMINLFLFCMSFVIQPDKCNRNWGMCISNIYSRTDIFGASKCNARYKLQHTPLNECLRIEK